MKLRVIDNFCITMSLPEEYITIKYKNNILCDISYGYLWRWFSLPPNIDKNQSGVIIIDGVDNYD